MKRIIAILCFTALLLTGCGNSDTEQIESVVSAQDMTLDDSVEITLWTYPIGSVNSTSTLATMVQKFNTEHRNINVVLKAVDYQTGDSDVESAIENGEAPDIVFEGPERLIANWGSRGLLVPVDDVWGTVQMQSVYDSVASACVGSDGSHYMIPICMTTHCMAINKDMFEKAGALKYVDVNSYTWSVDDFVSAVEALYNDGSSTVLNLYCKDQSGDQGTRALITNMYGGSYTNAEHTAYTVDDTNNLKALQLLSTIEGIDFNKDLTAADDIAAFCKQEVPMTLCWNVGQEMSHGIVNNDISFDVIPLTFPTTSGTPELQGGIWGFGIFDNGNEQKVEAAKLLIKYFVENDSVYEKLVNTTSYWPTRDLPNLYVNDNLMTEYSIFNQYFGDFYQITTNWTDARAAWWQMLQEIGQTGDCETAVNNFQRKVSGN